MAAARTGDMPGQPAPVPGHQAVGGAPRGDAVGWVAALYAAHYRSLVGLAALLVQDAATAEKVVQDAFVVMHANWRWLEDRERACAFLRRCVVNRSRSVLRRQPAVTSAPPLIPAGAPAPPGAVTGLLARPAVVTALRGLPARQREVLVLRYYADLPQAEIASVMGVSQGAVERLATRGMAALRGVLEGGP